MKNHINKHKFSLPIAFILISIFFINVSWKTNNTSKNFKVTGNNDTISNTKITKEILFNNYINKFYTQSNLQSVGLSLPLFQKTMVGYLNLRKQNLLNNQKNILSIIDFTKESTQKRLWIIDIKNQKLLLTSLVAHGQGSGENFATQFSNTADSHQSSLGFFVTQSIYIGKHGESLVLDGLDNGINSLAKSRSIVIHGAEYVSEEFIKQHGRLGRSFGCPAVPEALKTQIIELIKDKTMLYINGTQTYSSKHLDLNIAYNNLQSLVKNI
jgi:hypothetical protein